MHIPSSPIFGGIDGRNSAKKSWAEGGRELHWGGLTATLGFLTLLLDWTVYSWLGC
ncbi:hypothetical protein BDZ91DRAFT_709159 [Kalaharituber pfeilii]|nr:hypothetical protein BDZ91DRAFT_709159 [Kalaharituber pfeilii]